MFSPAVATPRSVRRGAATLTLFPLLGLMLTACADEVELPAEPSIPVPTGPTLPDPAPTESIPDESSPSSPPSTAPSTAPPSDDPAALPSDETNAPSEDGGTPDTPSPTIEINTEPQEWDPQCGDALPKIEPTIVQAVGLEHDEEPANGIEALAITGYFTAETTTLEASIYGWVVLTQNDVVVSPMLLGSDAVAEISLAAGQESSFAAGHTLDDYCQELSGQPLDPLPSGDYQAHLGIMDLGAYSADESRKAWVVFDPVDVNIRP